MFTYCANCPIIYTDPLGTFEVAVDPLRGGRVGGGGTVGFIFPFAWIVDTIDSLVATYDNWKDKHENALSETKAYAKAISSNNEKYVVHHIVAKGAPLASPARDVLKSVGIEPRTNGLNLAVIPQRVHLSLHTTSYYLYINSRLNGLEGNRTAVEATLAELQVEIQIYCQTGFKAW